MKWRQEETEAAVRLIRTDLEGLIKHQMKDVLSCVDQKKQGPGRELTEKIDGTQSDLQAVKTSLCSLSFV
jgi:hypothetical protein